MKKFLMKVLFRLYPDGSEMLDETTVQKAYDHLIAAANKDMRDWLYLHEEDILMHADETLLDAIQNNPSPVITQFVGLRLSYDERLYSQYRRLFCLWPYVKKLAR